MEKRLPPSLSDSMKEKLPRPWLPERPDLVEAYDAAWAIAAEKGVRQALPALSEGKAFLDATFSERIYQWDSCFITMWAKYAQGAFEQVPNVMSCLDNFYALQDEDGAICREYLPDGTPFQNKFVEQDNKETEPFQRHSAFTNPPLFSWAEWEYFQLTGDDSRLERVLPILSRYFNWYLMNRARDDGFLWYDSFGSGMDNCPRPNASGWVDYTCQAALDAEFLGNIALHVGDNSVAEKCGAVYLTIKELVNEKMWLEEESFYTDVDEDGFWAGVMHIGSYWAMMADLTNPERAARMKLHLKSYRSFGRKHLVPTLAAHVKQYSVKGEYWRGSVWPPTTYMVVRALDRVGDYDFAHEVALNHVEACAQVFKETGTFWENYAPDSIAPGNIARPDFCGWSALGPIALLLEYVVGVSANASLEEVIWRPRLFEDHGIENLKVGGVLVSIKAILQQGKGWLVTVSSTGPMRFLLKGFGGTEVVVLKQSGETTKLVR
jgi:glycogen debranching enzyme